MNFHKSKPLKGHITIPGDKSISHRAVMFGGISKGTTEITGFLQGDDCLSTISCFREMGINIENNGNRVIVHGNGLHGLKAPSRMLDVGNSGTTTRLISGILAAQNFTTVLSGDSSLNKRPMKRIITPLSLMGANIDSTNGCAPLTIKGAHLKGIEYISPVASAQIKSCVLLAGLYAEGITSVTEPSLSRNHTELMLNAFGANVTASGLKAIITPPNELFGQKVCVPGDISSAAYFIAAGLIVPGSEILIKNVGLNPTRDGLIKVCLEMGGNITIENKHIEGGEPVGDLVVRHSNLTGTTIQGDIIPTLIDEIPIIAVLASYASGQTVIADAAELKVKECNRIDAMTTTLSDMGVDITATDDGMIINGGKPLHGALIKDYMDHRIAMSLAVASLNAEGVTTIENADIANVSYPGFYKDLERLQS